MLDFIKNKLVIKSKISNLRESIQLSKVYSPKNISKFIFICGANQSEGVTSARRQQLILFSKSHLPHTQFFLAEEVFNTLNKEGHTGNILDIEHKISDFADHILIVLESNSAFTELGAFCSESLRKKLIVINDSKYKSSKSFINLGPLKAIEEASGSHVVISYKMGADGVSSIDGIADTFGPVYDLLKHPINPKRDFLTLESCNPSEKFNKNSAMFVHDLVYITGPILYSELIEVLKQIFGIKANYKLKEHLAILVSFNSIKRSDKGLYETCLKTTYYQYSCDINSLISVFRNYAIKYFPERIYER